LVEAQTPLKSVFRGRQQEVRLSFETIYLVPKKLSLVCQLRDGNTAGSTIGGACRTAENPGQNRLIVFMIWNCGAGPDLLAASSDAKDLRQ